ncbi:MAG TPA: hypothetical protein VNF68_04285 [Candidatus Baltobacteraceae bacterium]|nr:hypothetical protein [Candidatus Baltobacteraceae bacterium]
MRDRGDWIRERRDSRMGGHLELHLSGRLFTVEFIDGTGRARYAVDRERAFNESHGRVDDVEFSQIVAALKMATHDCFGASVHSYAPSSAVFEIQFEPGMSPFGNGRRVFIEGRLADLMRDEIGHEGVTFEYPVRVDGAAPQWVRMTAKTITGLTPVA